MPSAKPMPAPARRRLSREERHAQLIDTARRLVREEGTDALTLGRLAGQAGVTKPVVYDHFETRNGLLVALYRDYDARQTAIMDAALAACAPTLAARAEVIASAYVRCVMTQGQEIPGVAAALVGAPEMDALKRSYQAGFIDKCRAILAPFAEGGSLALAALWAMLGAADALSDAAARGEIARDEAVQELRRIILGMVERARPGP
ncbi:TetR/AcrR family transcriptional regulator [Rhodovastum atsumiense]|uniref:TetR/AcrR family transcriptional regulator n=1 Tax=Rhodovastum atsumiense TaxID=504468 RepID=A0A5M6IPA1_9PROT|nr:TetR/AcrR family transcriptional regulator [Rhodovastum atsumiense]KAA5609285.1 TetR/AcrR family transcriptional regulator [Rhodovastum atsumiense]CAH2604584.1 TetR/AcrR family transcriptional regulator [Rhodovastum atsumiense]